MKRIIAVVALILGMSFSASPAQAKYADFIQHGPVGNPHTFSIICTSDGSTRTLAQGQYSQDHCPFNGRVNQFFVAPGYSICIRPYYQPNVGCQYSYSGGTWWLAPSGAWYAWTVAA
jgi:hypothetical protein